MRFPALPEGVECEPSVDAPEGWVKGQAAHTGGNIYCRIWETEYNEQYTVEVVHSLPKADGVGLNLKTSDKEWVSEVDIIYTGNVEARNDDFWPDEEIQSLAVELMQSVNDGEYDDEIEALF